jgi:lysophospholipase L1-like esterase
MNDARSWRQRLPNIKRAVGLGVSSAAIGFLLLELVSRRFLPAGSPIERKFPVEVVRQPQPYTMFGGAAHGRLAFPVGTRERLNGRGYRGAEPEAVKPPGEFRVFVVGGSTVFAGEPPLPVLLEGQLRQKGLTHVRCFNYGVVSSVSGMELARIVFEIADLQPDLIVLYSGANDLVSPIQYDPRPGYPFNFIAYEHNPLLQRDVAAYPTLALLAYGSNVLRAAAPSFFAERFVRLQEARRQAGYGSPEWQQAIVAHYVGNLVKSEQVSRAFGADFVAYFQPVLHFKPSLGPEERQFAAPLGELARLTRELRTRVLPELERRHAQGLTVRDLSGTFDSVAGDVFYDYIHVTLEGNQILARAVAEDLAGRIPPPRARALSGHR